MDADIRRSSRSPPAHIELRSPATAGRGVRANESIERAGFWLFVAALAWVPFWYGSNDQIAWGINAVLFPGLALLYELSLLARGGSHPVGIKTIALPAALFGAVLLWVLLQTVSWLPAVPVHPIWTMAGEPLGRPLAGSVSVNRDLTFLALIKLITAASTFWLALEFCRNARRARLLIAAVAAIGSFYAGYGLLEFALKTGHMPWLESRSTGGSLTSTFVNHNSFATYAGIATVAVCGLMLRQYRHELSGSAGLRRLTIAWLMETTGRSGAALLAGAFLLLTTVLLTGSRAGVIATMLGLMVLAGLTFVRRNEHGARPFVAVIFSVIFVAATLFGFGELFIGNLTERGVGDTNRMSVYLITVRSILDSPLWGFGYGTFMDVFPLYRDRSISVQGAWQQAHNTYLEVFQGLGVVFGAMLVGSVVLLVLRCVRGATTRQENTMVPCVAVAAASLVGFHALVDFSLQIQAVALTFAAVLGAGVAQSASSRVILAD